MFCICDFCFFCVNVAALVYHSTYFYSCLWVPGCLHDERLQTVLCHIQFGRLELDLSYGEGIAYINQSDELFFT